jgi:hypothetical protein
MNLNEMTIAVSCLHDGTITSIEQTSEQTWDTLTISIEIPYLAEIINPEYIHFTYQFVNYHELFYESWNNDKRERDIATIVSMELEINEVVQEEAYIKITCLCNTPGNDGGHLYIQAEDLIMYDQGSNNLTFEEIQRITKAYWHKTDRE